MGAGRKGGTRGNQNALGDDFSGMDCNSIREAASAMLDGEIADVDGGTIERHLETCGACRAYVANARDLRAALRAGLPATSSLAVALRIGLVAVAAAQFALAVPTLLFGSDEGAPVHIAHEIGAWDLALAVAFVFAAWRPLRAVGLLPFVAALAAGLLITAVLDVANGRAIALTETTHLLELLGAVLLWMLVAPRRRVRPRAELHLV